MKNYFLVPLLVLFSVASYCQLWIVDNCNTSVQISTSVGSNIENFYPGCSSKIYNGNEYVIYVDKQNDYDILWVTLWNYNSIDYDLFLFDNSNTCLQSSTNNPRNCSGGVQNFDAVEIAGSAGTYTVVIDGLSSGSFFIHTSCEGSNCAQAQTITCDNPSRRGSTINGIKNRANYPQCSPFNACFEYSGSFTGPEEYWEFLAPEDGTYIFTLEGDNPTQEDLELFVLSQCCETEEDDVYQVTIFADDFCEEPCVSSQSAQGGIEELTINLLEGETIWLVVDGFLDAEDSYTLSVQCQNDCTWDREIECGITYQGDTRQWNNNFNISDYASCFSSSSSFNGDDIVYKFNKPNNSGNLAVTLRHASGSSNGNFTENLSMFLLDGCGNGEFSCLGKANNYLDGNGNIRGEFILDADPPLPAGDYFLIIDGAESNVGGPFSLTVTCGDLDCTTAKSIRCGETLRNESNQFGTNNVSHYGCSLSGSSNWYGTIGREKVYRFDLTRQQNISITLSNISLNDDFELFLIDGCGTNANMNSCIESSTNAPGQNELIEVTLSAGTYYIVVDAWFEANTFLPTVGSYDLSLTGCEDCIDLSLRDECFIIYPLVNNQYRVNFNYNIPEAQGAQNIIWESQGNTIGGGDSVDFGMTPGATREICCYWEVDSGEVTRCYKLCKTICFPTNSDCDNIWFRPLDQFSGTNYEFSIQGTTEVLSWELHDDDGNIEFIDDDPDTEVVFSYTPAIGECLYVTATYRDSDGCIRICCRKFCFQELDCGRDVIEPVFTGNQQEVLNGQYRYRFNDLIPINAQVLKWKAYPSSLQSDVIETDPANPELLLTTLSETSQTTYRICCIYELGGCVRVCCIDICLNNPYQCGSSALVTCNYEDNTYDIQSFVSNVTVLYWTDDSGNRLSQYDGLADITYPISELSGQRFLYCYYQECLDVPFGEFPISSCWNSVCCIPLPDCNQDCYLSCCRDSDRTWLENLKVSYAQNCNSCPFNNENTIIRECTFQDQCYIEVERQNCDDGSGLVDWTYEYYTCDGQFYNPPLDAFPSCRVIWDCRTGEVPECPDCVEKCCDNDNTLDALIANANSFITIYQCDYLGQCVYDVRYNDPSLIDEENGSIYNCQGALIGSYSFFNPAALENLQNCRPIWNYYYGKVETCDDSECNNPVSEVCEDFNNYTSNVGISSQSNNWFVLNNNQDCRVMGSNGAKYLWVERQGFDYCESAMRINENSGTDAIIELSFDITIPYYNFGSFPLQADGADIYIYEQDQNSQNYINIAFRPHSSDATNDDRRICLRITDKYESDGCFSGDGELFPYYRNSTNRVSITLDKSTGDVKVFINQDLLAEASNSGLSQLGMIGFSSIFNPVGGYRIDNICTQVCRDRNGGGGNTEPIICEIAEVCGGIGDRVRIPVRVKNFNNVAAFSLGLDLIRDIGDFTGVILANQQLINERLIFQGNSSPDGKFLEIIYATSGQRITLPDNTAILELEVEITNSNIGEAEIRGASQPDPLANVLDNNGNSSDTPIIIESGEVCYQETSVSLSGRIITEENVAIADVDVLLSGPVNDRDFTDSDGRYIFEDIQQGSQNRISPTLNSYVYEAINVSDLVVMIDHILSNNLISSHYKLIAADMNEDERISVTDLTMLIDVILRNPILGDPWIFVEEDFIFNNAEPSIEQDYPRDIFLSNIQNNNSNLDFIGIHKGDLNGSFNGIKNQNSRIPTKKSCLSFIINEKSLTQGEEKLVTITLDSFETLRTFSAELNIDLDQLEVLEVISDNSDLSNDLSIELNDLDKGYIKLLWFTLSSNGQSLPMGSELLTLRVKAKTNTTLNQSIAVTSDLITSETVNAMNEEGCISLMFMTSTSIQDMVDSDKLTLYPSPWYDQTTLQFESYSYDDMTFTITTIDGKEVLSRKVSVVSGLNQIVINEESIDNHHGILIYHLQSEDKHYVGKMIKH